jgi:hypothetical protein
MFMSTTGFEPPIPATAWALESAKYVINNKRSQKKGTAAPARTSHKHEKMKSTVYPYLFYKVGSLLLSSLFSLPALVPV